MDVYRLLQKHAKLRVKMSSNRKMTRGRKKASIGIGTIKNRILKSYYQRTTWKMALKISEFSIVIYLGPLKYQTLSCKDSESPQNSVHFEKKDYQNSSRNADFMAK